MQMLSSHGVSHAAFVQQQGQLRLMKMSCLAGIWSVFIQLDEL